MKFKTSLRLGIGLCLACLPAAFCDVSAQSVGTSGGGRKPKLRAFLFTYQAAVTGLKAGQKARIWLPIPANTPHQQIKVVSTQFPYGRIKETKGPRYGNEFFYLEARGDDDGRIPCRVTYRVRREEVLGDTKSKDVSAALRRQFLQANRMTPIGGKPALTLLKDAKLPDDQLGLGKALYDIVNEHMKYQKPKGRPWGRGDAVWACDSKYGNCTDFHSLFISLARTRKIPAKFEIGFSLPPKRGKGEIGGYHCWGWFQPQGRGWLPVDISEANRHRNMAKYYFGNLTENRIAFTAGRDLVLNPRQDGPPLNFFVYPYVEVGGQPYPQAKIQKRFSYEDLK